MKTAYAFNPTTLIFTGAVPISLITGYPNYIKPKFALWQPAPEHDQETQQCRADIENESWIIEAKSFEVTAYHKQTSEPKTFEDATLVTDDYTLAEPQSRFDEWIDGAWVADLQNQFEAGVFEVDSVRRNLYQRRVDPLLAEATIKKELGELEESQAMITQALAAREKIQTENPWPIPPA